MAAHGYVFFFLLLLLEGVEKGVGFRQRNRAAPILVIAPNFNDNTTTKKPFSAPSLKHQSPAAKAGYASCCHALVADGGADTELKDVERKTALFVR